MKEINIDDLATRLDKVEHDFDTYNYMDCDGNVEMSKRILVEDPYTIIDRLLEIIEEVM